MNIKELEFVVFIIHKLALAWNKRVSLVYKTLKETNILDEYIIPHYEVLHSLGEEYLINDITELLLERQGDIK